MVKSRRVFAAVLVVAVCLAMVFSVCFIAVQADHDCSGADCAICAQLHVCQKLLQVAVTVMVLSALALAEEAVFHFYSVAKQLLCSTSLVAHKVKLSN